MRNPILSRRATTTFAALLTVGLVACSPGESSDAPESERIGNAGDAADAADAASEVVTVPSGSMLSFRVEESISTDTHATGDVFMTSLAGDVTSASGDVLVPAGTRARWLVTEASADGGADGDALLVVGLEAVQLGGEWTPIQATVTDTQIENTASDSNTETAAKVAIGAAAGAILGQVIGKDTESTLTGAGVGAAVGTAVALTTRGSKATLPAGSIITVQLDEAVVIR